MLRKKTQKCVTHTSSFTLCVSFHFNALFFIIILRIFLLLHNRFFISCRFQDFIANDRKQQQQQMNKTLSSNTFWSSFSSVFTFHTPKTQTHKHFSCANPSRSFSFRSQILSSAVFLSHFCMSLLRSLSLAFSNTNNHSAFMYFVPFIQNSSFCAFKLTPVEILFVSNLDSEAFNLTYSTSLVWIENLEQN